MSRKVSLRIAVALLSLLIGLVILLLSPWGTRLAVNLADSQLDPLKIEYRSGGLASQVKLDSLRWQDESAEVHIENVVLELNLGCLFGFNVCVDYLGSGNIQVDIPPSDKPAQDNEPGEPFSLPVDVTVSQLNLGKLMLRLEQQWTLEWQSLQSQLELNDALKVSKLSIVALDWQQLSTDKPAAVSAPFDPAGFQYQPLQLPEVTLPLAFNLNNISIAPITINPASAEPVKFSKLEMAARGKQHNVNLSRLLLEHKDFKLNAQGKVSLDKDYDHSLNVTVRGNSKPYQQQKLQWISGGDISDLNSTLELTGKMSAKLAMQANLTAQHLPLHIQANWKNLQWPLQQPQFESANGELLLDGDLTGMTLMSSAKAEGPDIPSLEFQLDAKGNQQQIEINELLVKVLGGDIQAQGRLAIADKINWQGKLNVHHIQAEQFWPELKSDISGSLQTQASYQAERWQAKVRELDINGQWLSYPLSVSGELQADSEQGLNIDNLTIHNGDNQFALNGTVDQKRQIDLQLNLQAPNLSQVLPQLAGAAQLEGEASGTLMQPKVTFSLSGQQWRYDQWQVGQTRGKGALQWNDIKPVELSLRMEQISSANHQLDYIEVDLNGNAKDHHLNIDSRGEQALFLAEFNGQLQEHQWSGQWLKGDIQSRYGQLTLQQAFDIQLDWQNQNYQISAHCWQQQGSLCVNQAEYHQGQASWDIELQDLPIAPLLSRFIPPLSDLQSKSQLSAKLNGDWDGQGLPIANLTASLTPAIWRLAQSQKMQLSIDQFDISASLDQQQGQLSVALNGRQIGQLNAAMQVDPKPGDRPVEGTIKLNNFDLHPFISLMPELDKLAGIIEADTRIEGTLSKPELFGSVKLQDGELSGTNIPVVVTRLQQNIELQGQYGNIDGSFQLGSGKGSIEGRIEWLPALAGTLNIQGQELEIIYQNMLKGRVSPDIALTFDPEQIDVKGQVQIPYARIRLKDLPEDAVSPSKDVVIVSEKKPVSELQQKLGMDLQIQIDPKKRNEVKIDALGLTTDLQGEIRIQQAKQNRLASGEISLNNGRYRAYGQNLLIREGSLLFHGPLDQPHISLEAIRDPALTADEVIAGLRVDGNIEQPTVEVFSDPVMEQPQSLSYLLRGRALGTGNDEGQDTMLTTMLLGFGLGRTENLVGSVGNKFGVKDLTLDTSGQGDNTQLALTGYIAPGVQLRYGLGVFNSASEIALRYELMPQLYLEAVSGLSNALDLYYSFSIDDDKPEEVQQEESNRE